MVFKLPLNPQHTLGIALVTMKSESKETIVGVADAAKMLGVSGDTVRRWHKKGLVNAVISANGERQFRLSDLSKLLEQKNSSSSHWKVLTAAKTRVSTIELFCGAGGLALGLENAGLVSKLVVDFDKDCINTIKANRPNWDAQSQIWNLMNLLEALT